MPAPGRRPARWPFSGQDVSFIIEAGRRELRRLKARSRKAPTEPAYALASLLLARLLRRLAGSPWGRSLRQDELEAIARVLARATESRNRQFRERAIRVFKTYFSPAIDED